MIRGFVCKLSVFGLSDSDEFSAGFQNIRDRAYDRSRSNLDARQRFTASFAWQLPFGRGHHLGGGWNALVDSVLGGWQLVGIVTLRTGFPFTPTVPGDPANVGGSNRPNRLADGRVDDRTLERWYDPKAFAAPERYTFGTSGRNILSGPGLRRGDISVHKGFRVREGQRVQLRAEFFNLTNTPKFGNPGANVTAASAGHITSASGEREIQFALKYIF